jgi:hypothetical protein
MLTWISIVTNDAPPMLAKGRMPPVSAAVVGSTVVFRLAYGFSTAATSVPFASQADAAAWVEANRASDE